MRMEQYKLISIQGHCCTTSFAATASVRFGPCPVPPPATFSSKCFLFCFVMAAQQDLPPVAADLVADVPQELVEPAEPDVAKIPVQADQNEVVMAAAAEPVTQVVSFLLAVFLTFEFCSASVKLILA